MCARSSKQLAGQLGSNEEGGRALRLLLVPCLLSERLACDGARGAARSHACLDRRSAMRATWHGAVRAGVGGLAAAALHSPGRCCLAGAHCGYAAPLLPQPLCCCCAGPSHTSRHAGITHAWGHKDVQHAARRPVIGGCSSASHPIMSAELGSARCSASTPSVGPRAAGCRAACRLLRRPCQIFIVCPC